MVARGNSRSSLSSSSPLTGAFVAEILCDLVGRAKTVCLPACLAIPNMTRGESQPRHALSTALSIIFLPSVAFCSLCSLHLTLALSSDHLLYPFPLTEGLPFKLHFQVFAALPVSTMGRLVFSERTGQQCCCLRG